MREQKIVAAFLCLAVVPMTLLVATAYADESEFKSIFDGKTLNGWDGDPQRWQVEDGAITGRTSADQPLKTNTFIIWRQGEVDDFELKLEYRMFGGNSGIQYRSFEKLRDEKWGRWVVGGYQADIDSENRYTGILYAERDRGILAMRGTEVTIGDDHKPQVIAKTGDADQFATVIKKEDWNQYHIIARGNRLVHKINDQVMVKIEDNDKQMRRFGGILALQLHVGPPMKVQFRNIRIKRLPLENRKKVVFIAGAPSHDYANHEHNAGCMLLADLLNKAVPGIYAAVYRNGWPTDPTAFDNVDGIVIYSDGGGGQPVLPHLDQVDKLMKKGVGLACLHYAVEVPKEQAGDRFLSWIGGFFEGYWSVNPFWTAEYKSLPDHPITRGVKPFTMADEWYYHIRFVPEMKGVTPILTATPPDSTREQPDGFHSGNPHVRARKGMPEHTAWAYLRPDGGRGFGLTGGHIHWNWACDGFRKIVLNAVLWVTGVDVPAGGVESPTPTYEELEVNQDKPQPKDFDREAIRKQLQSLCK